MVKLSKNRYGKARIRLLKVTRDAADHDVLEWTLFVAVEGNFEACFIDGDNSRILPADTIKNTVYSLARNSRARSMEDFAQEVIGFILDWNSQIESVKVEVEQVPWQRIQTGEVGHPSSFQKMGPEIWTACAVGSRTAGIKLQAGIRGLVVVKTSNSSFIGFIKDSLTTIEESSDRLLRAEAAAKWTYSQRDLPFCALRRQIRESLLKSFADHDSLSAHHTLCSMGKCVLESISDLVDIKIALTTQESVLADLTPFGQDNPNEIYIPVDDPQEFVEAKLIRG